LAYSSLSTGSGAARIAADCVEEWDNVDRSDERLVSGSDLSVAIDPKSGRRSTDWYDEEFEALLERLRGPETAEEEEDGRGGRGARE
jgi:hypothetical protein